MLDVGNRTDVFVGLQHVVHLGHTHGELSLGDRSQTVVLNTQLRHRVAQTCNRQTIANSKTQNKQSAQNG